MKKFTLFFAFVFLSFTAAFAQWSENFDAGTLPAGWAIETAATDGGYIVGTFDVLSSQFFPISDLNGTAMIATNDDACNCDKLLDRLITPDIDLSMYTNPIFSFDALFPGATFEGNTETAFVDISTDGGVTWTELGAVAPTVDGVAWTQNAYSLAGYTGTVRLSIRYSDGTGWLFGIAIDNVSVAEAIPVDVTFNVNMGSQTVSANGVHVAGSFQGWTPGATPMSDPDGDGIYSVTVQILQGTEVQYKFINGNAWGSDESVPEGCGVPNGLGGFNRAVTVGAGATDAGTYCFAGCFAICANPGDICELPVTANEGSNLCPGLVFPSGSQDGATNAFWYSFTASQTGAVLLSSCGGGVDTRVWVYEGDCSNLTLIGGNDDFCDMGDGNPYASSYAFAVTNGTTYYIQWDDRWSANAFEFTMTYDVELANPTFSVDMTGQTVDPAGVHIYTPFDPQTAIRPMTDAGNNIWTITDLPNMYVGATAVYLFINGDNTGTPEDAIDNCGADVPGYNVVCRNSTIDVADAVFGPNCFNTCADCAQPRQVTLICDMEHVIQTGGSVNAAGVHLAGDFQEEAGFSADWVPAETSLTNITGTNQWSVTLTIPDGVYEYKYLNGNAWGTDENIGADEGDCGVVGGFGNRSLTISQDTTIEYCFNYCFSCSQVINTNNIAFDAALKLAPNPANSEAVLTYKLDNASALSIRMTNQLGQVMNTQAVTNAQNGSVRFDLTTTPAGVYFVHVTDGTFTATKRLVVEK